MRDDGPDRDRQRNDQQEEEDKGHERHRDPAPPTPEALHRDHRLPGRDDDHHRPDRRRDERAQHPEGRGDEPADEKHHQHHSREVLSLHLRHDVSLLPWLPSQNVLPTVSSTRVPYVLAVPSPHSSPPS